MEKQLFFKGRSTISMAISIGITGHNQRVMMMAETNLIKVSNGCIALRCHGQRQNHPRIGGKDGLVPVVSQQVPLSME